VLLDLIQLERASEKPIFRQLADQLADLIRNGMLVAGSQLPGTRQMAIKLKLHRKTVVAAVDELAAQGWLETKPGKGTFVATKIDGLQYRQLPGLPGLKAALPPVIVPAILDRSLPPNNFRYHLDDGLPDPRLAPVEELARAWKTALTQGWRYPRYGYGDTRGQQLLRERLGEYLLKTRGMKIMSDQILITRGVTQALYLVIKGFVGKGDKVAIGALNWESASINFRYHGAELIRVRVDDEGLDVDHLEEICREHPLKMVYVTPHHQYPTTVIMPAYRRIKLIRLARTYGFYLFEDDYDYDFHYAGYPLMPLASAGHQGSVLYTGSFTKAISPAFRVGYLVATAEQIDFLARLRRLVDRQGDPMLELAIAELLDLGVITRYLRKNRKIYQSRRDYFAALLRDQLPDYLDFRIPDGGMAIWTKFRLGIDLQLLARKAIKRDLYFQDGTSFQTSPDDPPATRLGFASSNEKELEEAVSLLKSLLKG
jgi:GntR family transcriptional regulator / MocR family aminotransferase